MGRDVVTCPVCKGATVSEIEEDGILMFYCPKCTRIIAKVRTTKGE